jgi:hypothetical protein
VTGIDFINPGSTPGADPAFDRLAAELIAPSVFLEKNPLTDHLWAAMWHPSIALTAVNHVQRVTAHPFTCASYYADDPAVMAYCAAGREGHLATIGMSFVRRLVKICGRLGGPLKMRPRVPKEKTTVGRPERDDVLTGLLAGTGEVSEAEALDIVASWPSADTQSAQIELGEYTLFYDLIRLIWLHEWAHALCGHVHFTSNTLGLAQLHEWSADRMDERQVEKLGYPRYEVLQALELHADEFATRYCVGEILWGFDPIGQIAGPNVDLIDRLLMFNVACCVFAVIWSLAERQYYPDMSFVPGQHAVPSGEPDPLFVTFKTSHPPAALRYYRFRDFERELAVKYSAAMLSPMVDAVSIGFLDTLAYACPHFYQLLHQTPMIAKTPTMKRLEAYEGHLLQIGNVLTPFLETSGYLPTRSLSGDDQ